MHPLLYEFLSSFSVLTQDDIEGIGRDLPIEVYQKGDLLLQEGSGTEYCYYILKGAARQYQLIDGEERTTSFFTEMEPVTVSHKDELGRSLWRIECSEGCIAIKGKTENQESMLEKYPNLQKVMMGIMEKHLNKAHFDLNTYISASPENRYQALLKNRPDIFQRFPQHQIASYLGMKPESLSRIKKRLFSKG